jgi:hypothetical protein
MNPEEPSIKHQGYEPHVDRKILHHAILELIWTHAPSDWTLDQAIRAKQKIENIFLAQNQVAFNREVGK